MPRIVFLQCQVSQLDEPVYARMHALEPGCCAVVYWNDYGFERRRVDPEMGVVPDFRQADLSSYPRSWIDRRAQGREQVLGELMALDPRVVVLSDQPQLERLRLARALRKKSKRVALRVDKNHLSQKPRRGLALLAERQLTHRSFDLLAPTSRLTTEYYAWPASQPSLLFPYSTNEEKFTPAPRVKAEKRLAVRERLGIRSDAHVFVSATKFSARESPWELIESFARATAERTEMHLIALGDGPMRGDIERHCASVGLSNVSFPGFVPFRELPDYFFASDSLLHLVSVGPWEVSPQDALVAGLGVITTERVGSAQVFLQGPLRRFLVPFGDRRAAAERMCELAHLHDVAALFADARARTANHTVEATARRWIEARI